ncbi:O-antigen ligase family protein [Flavobacterium sp. FlaQc-48]|uniref:O-antigen ligase family protein n=1 Tax=Flavobacterium sp. FlaQc-48 TaxID=3374181 RepID=UPI003756B9F6
MLLISAAALFSSPSFNSNRFFSGIAVIATLESLYCMGQYGGWFKSQNILFPVTGSWVNPNVTAMFLALAIPVFLFLFRSKYGRISQFSFIILVAALYLLKCRAALIGAVVSAVLFYGLEYQFINWLKNKKNRFTLRALIIIGILIIIPLGSTLYNAKKASAEGRKFIWKISSLMILDKPLTGYGYGYFEKEYNLFQADYIQKGKATAKELENAGPVEVAHNEFFQNAVEGGFLGLFLASLFFGSLLFTIRQRKKIDTHEIDSIAEDVLSAKANDDYFNASYAAVIGFIAMSFFEFTMQAIPVMGLLTIYSAVVCSKLKPLQLSSKPTFLENNKIFSIVFKIAIILMGLHLLCLVIRIAGADRQNKKASLFKNEGRYEKAMKIMPALAPYLKGDSNYWKNYGSLYFSGGNYPSAIVCLAQAKKTSSSCELYLGMGICYEKLKQYPAAIAQYKQLVSLHPGKFSYRFRLMNTYLKSKDTLKTIAAAQGILDLHPKIPSDKVLYYKRQAVRVLSSLRAKPVPINRVQPAANHFLQNKE